MNNTKLHTAGSVALGLLCTASAAWAQTTPPDQKPSSIRPPERTAEPNRFGLSYRFGLNISASFKNTGVLPLAVPGAALGGIDHTYNDGYMRVDYSQNAGGETWNWDYSSASQVHGNNVVMSASNPGDITRNVDGDPQHGLELTFNRELGHVGSCPWGLEAAFGFTDLTFRNRAVVNGGPLTVDAYAVAEGPVPLPPQGTYDGPGPLIFDTPTRLPVTVASRLDGSMYGFRLGPYLEIPLGKRVAFTLSGGLALAVVDTDFSFQQSYVAPVDGTVSESHAGSHSDVLAGGFIAGTFSCRLTKALTVFAGAQYQNTGTYTHSLADKRAEIDLSTCVFVTAGLGLAF